MARFWGRVRQTAASEAPVSDRQALLERVQERMSLMYETWRIMTVGEAMEPRGLAIVFGMMDSVGQSLGADRDVTGETMKLVLGKAKGEGREFMLCMAAGHDPALRPWVMAGGQAIHELTMGDGSPREILAALAVRYLADIKAAPDVV